MLRNEDESMEDAVTRFNSTFTEFDNIVGDIKIVAQQSAAKQVAKIVEGAEVLEDPSQFWTWQESLSKRMISELADRDMAAASWQLLSPALQELVRGKLPLVGQLYKAVKYSDFIAALRSDPGTYCSRGSKTPSG